MSSWQQVYVKCPFYIDNGRQGAFWHITCNAPGDADRLKLVYDAKEDAEKQLELYCENGYKYCEVYRMLLEACEE
jgi:hypothetical protein